MHNMLLGNSSIINFHLIFLLGYLCKFHLEHRWYLGISFGGHLLKYFPTNYPIDSHSSQKILMLKTIPHKSSEILPKKSCYF